MVSVPTPKEAYSCKCLDGHVKSSSRRVYSWIYHHNCPIMRRFQIPGGVQECRQQVTSREGKVIKVDLSSVSLPSSSNCENYIEVLNGDSPDSVVILKYCGNGIATAVSSTPNVIITWHIESTSGNVSPRTCSFLCTDINKVRKCIHYNIIIQLIQT